MTTKYHYEVYEKIEGDNREGDQDNTRQRFTTYNVAKEYLDNLNKLVHPEPRPRRDFGIDKWRTIYPNAVDLPTANTYAEAYECIKNGGMLWVEHIECDEECEPNCCLGTEDVETLKEETENGEEFETGHYHMDTGLTPAPERLGECVDGDLEDPEGEDKESLLNCEVCDKKLYEGDYTYMTTEGQVNGEGVPEDNGDEFITMACYECGIILSNAIDEARACIARIASGKTGEDRPIVTLKNEDKYLPTISDNGDQIALIWHIEDVAQRAEEQEIEVSEKEAKDILADMLRNLDCNHGITWETIDYQLDRLVDERKKD